MHAADTTDVHGPLVASVAQTSHSANQEGAAWPSASMKHNKRPLILLSPCFGPVRAMLWSIEDTHVHIQACISHVFIDHFKMSQSIKDGPLTDFKGHSTCYKTPQTCARECQESTDRPVNVAIISKIFCPQRLLLSSVLPTLSSHLVLMSVSHNDFCICR